MRRILMIMTFLLFIICLVSCNENKKLINGKIIYEGNSYKVEVEESSTIANEIILIEDNEYMEIYYDEELTIKYNGKKATCNEVFYLKSNIISFEKTSIEDIYES